VFHLLLKRVIPIPDSAIKCNWRLCQRRKRECKEQRHNREKSDTPRQLPPFSSHLVCHFGNVTAADVQSSMADVLVAGSVVQCEQNSTLQAKTNRVRAFGQMRFSQYVNQAAMFALSRGFETDCHPWVGCSSHPACAFVYGCRGLSALREFIQSATCRLNDS
jgi:hypothetical protein